MKTKILATVALTTLLSSGLYANCNLQTQGMSQKNSKSCQMTKNYSCKMNKKGSHMKKSDYALMGIFKKLNLSDDQKTKMRDIKRDIFNTKRAGVETAFTKNGFDKAKYLELMKQKRDYMLESQAQMLEKTYAILTPIQKEQFKVLLDLQSQKRNSMDKMAKRGMNFDKNCNGRR